MGGRGRGFWGVVSFWGALGASPPKFCPVLCPRDVSKGRGHRTPVIIANEPTLINGAAPPPSPPPQRETKGSAPSSSFPAPPFRSSSSCPIETHPPRAAPKPPRFTPKLPVKPRGAPRGEGSRFWKVPFFWDKSPFLGRCPGLVRAPLGISRMPWCGRCPAPGGNREGAWGGGSSGGGDGTADLAGIPPPRGEEVPGEMGRGLGGVWAVGLSGVGGEGVRGGWKNRGNTGWGWNIRGRGSLGFFGTPRMGRGVGIWGALFWGSRVLGGRGGRSEID